MAIPPPSVTQGDFGTDLRWYLEDYLDYPFAPRLARASQLTQAVRDWGQQVFGLLFNRGTARVLYDHARRDGLSRVRITIASEDPAVLSWPWEALEDPQGSILSLTSRFERHIPLPRLRAPTSLAPPDAINILLVIARPYERDIGYRSIATPLLELIEDQRLAARVTVLRPPTFRRLREVLAERPGHFHVLHFDGHGATQDDPRVPTAHRSPSGALVFEDDTGKPHALDASQLSNLLHDYRIPIVVLNACRSAKIDPLGHDPFASVATALLKGGTSAVIAMTHALYVAAAKQFLPLFYHRLLEHGDVTDAVRAGRQQLFENPLRPSPAGAHALQDWIVPVLYRRATHDRLIRPPRVDHRPAPTRAMTNRATGDRRIVGRDTAFLHLERLLRAPNAAVLVHGLAGIGKTTLLRAYLHWLAQTNGQPRPAIWLSFHGLRHVESILNPLVAMTGDTSLYGLPLPDRIDRIVSALRRNPYLLIWDNFESLHAPNTGHSRFLPTDLAHVRTLLYQLRDSPTKVLITSRTPEEWLGATTCSRLPLLGLQGEERWDYAATIERDLGLAPIPHTPTLAATLNSLGGHPLMMRVILQRLAAGAGDDVRRALTAASSDTSSPTLESRLAATLTLLEDSLPPSVRPLCALLSLHDRFVQARALLAMATVVNASWTPHDIERLLGLLSLAGLATPSDDDHWELHPALTEHLRETLTEEALQPWPIVFVQHISALAHRTTPLHLSKQRGIVAKLEDTIWRARSIAKRLHMRVEYSRLTQFLASYALNSRLLDSADTLFADLQDTARGAQDRAAESAALHMRGRVADEQRRFAAAEGYYQEALAIDEALGDQRGTSLTYHQLGLAAQRRGDLETAQQRFEQSLAIKIQLNDTLGTARAYHQLGTLAAKRGDWDTSEELLTKALAQKKHTSPDTLCVTYRRLAKTAHDRGDPLTAEKYLRKAAHAAADLDDKHELSRTHRALGRLAMQLLHDDTAEQHLLRALVLDEQLGGRHDAGAACFLLGRLSFRRDDVDAAEAWFRRAWALTGDDADRRRATAIHNALGLVAYRRGDFETAGNCFAESLRAATESEDQIYTGIALRNLQRASRKVSPEVASRWRTLIPQ